MENPLVPAAAADGSDRKLLLELRKVQDTSWGGEHEKVTLPCRKETDASVSDKPGGDDRVEKLSFPRSSEALVFGVGSFVSQTSSRSAPFSDG